ncbi:Uncharacterised protein [Enterobacter cloacae]|nr:Uncharacterised protein [Enterobacter cloacae]
MLRADTERHLTPGVATIVPVDRQRHPAFQLEVGSRRIDPPVQQVHRRAADKARHKTAGRFFVDLHRGANLLGDAFVHHHHALGEGHGFNLIVSHIEGRGFQAAMQLL